MLGGQRMNFDRYVEHYANLALQKGWLDYVRHQVKQMEANPMFQGIENEVRQRIREIQNEKSRKER